MGVIATKMCKKSLIIRRVTTPKRTRTWKLIKEQRGSGRVIMLLLSCLAEADQLKSSTSDHQRMNINDVHQTDVQSDGCREAIK